MEPSASKKPIGNLALCAGRAVDLQLARLLLAHLNSGQEILIVGENKPVEEGRTELLREMATQFTIPMDLEEPSKDNAPFYMGLTKYKKGNHEHTN